MDRRRFDALSRSLSETDTRRRLLAALGAVPLLGGLASLLAGDAAAAKGRRKRRKKRHKHGKPRPHGRRRRCQAEPRTTTCAGVCGFVRNNCRKTVDCGSCDCQSPCAICQVCQAGPNTTGSCVPDPEKVGDPCGVCHTCNASGQCAPDDGGACDDGDPCLTGSTCTAGVCGGGATICTAPPECRLAAGATCSEGVCTYPVAAAGTPCGAGLCDVCDGTGTCVTGDPCAGGVCCDLATEVCFNDVCAVTCNVAPYACPAGASGCRQETLNGHAVNICVGAASGTCGCTLSESSCPTGQACDALVAECGNGSGCRYIFQPG